MQIQSLLERGGVMCLWGILAEGGGGALTLAIRGPAVAWHPVPVVLLHLEPVIKC